MADAIKRRSAIRRLAVRRVDADDDRGATGDENEDVSVSELAAGTVTSIEEREGSGGQPKHAVVSIRHGEKPKKGDGESSSVPSWPFESRVVIDISDAKRHSVGQKVWIVLERERASSSDGDGEE